MENLNAEQIKSDLAICALGYCRACHYNKFIAGCRDELCSDALDLINSQEQRIKELTEKNERLKKVNEYYSELEQGCFVTGVKNVQADTVSEIRARVAVHFGTYCEKDQVKIADVFKLIDQIAKEVLEGVE